MRPEAQQFVRQFSVALILLAAGCHSEKQSSAPEAKTPVSNSALEPATDPVVAKAFSPEAMRGAIEGHPVDPHSLSQTELHFGRAPERTPEVTYQDEVLIMEHGDTALRSMSADSLTWHFDANAPGVDQIQVDKVIFATERCVGRVLGVQRNGDDVAVQLGPVQITDVIKKGHFAYNQPVNLDSLVATPAPSMPWIAKMDENAPRMDINRDHLMSVTYAVVSPDGTWRPFRDQRMNATGRLVDTVLHQGVVISADRCRFRSAPGHMCKPLMFSRCQAPRALSPRTFRIRQQISPRPRPPQIHCPMWILTG